MRENNYELYWEKKSLDLNSFQKYRASWVSSQIETGSSLVDIAAGNGKVLLELKKNKNIKAIACDISNSALKTLNDQGIECFCIDINQDAELKKIPTADNIIAFELLEHLPNPEKVLVNLLPKCQKSFFFSVPNTGFISHRLRLLFGRFPLQWRNHPGEHLRFWTLKDMHWWLKELNLPYQYQVHCYEGFPILNKIFPGIFSKGILVQIKLNS